MSQANEGSIVSMRLNVGSRKPMKEVDSARVITGQGIEGDRHLKEDGSRSRRQYSLWIVRHWETFLWMME